MEINKRNLITQNRKAKKPYKILSYNLFTRINKKNPRKDNRERTIKNIRKKIAFISRTNGCQKE